MQPTQSAGKRVSASHDWSVGFTADWLTKWRAETKAWTSATAAAATSLLAKKFFHETGFNLFFIHSLVWIRASCSRNKMISAFKCRTACTTLSNYRHYTIEMTHYPPNSFTPACVLSLHSQRLRPCFTTPLHVP